MFQNRCSFKRTIIINETFICVNILWCSFTAVYDVWHFYDTILPPSAAGLCLWLRPGAGFLLRSPSLCLFARAKSFNSCQNGQIGEIHSSDYLHSFRKVTATNKEGYRGGRPLKAVVGVISKAIKKKLGWLFIKTECIRMYSICKWTTQLM